MSGPITLAIINNAAMLLALSVVYELSNILHHRLKKSVSLFNGILIGLIGIAIMSFPFHLTAGLFFDTRSILISVTALTFGLVPAALASSMTLIYRILLGGVGVYSGCATILVSLTLGLLFRRFMTLDRTKFRVLKLYAFGIAVHIGMLACMLLLPWDNALSTLRSITSPVLIIYPVGVVVLTLLLLRQSEYKEALTRAVEADSRYKSLFYNNLAVMLIIDPKNGQIIDANPAAVSFYGWPLSELKKMHISQINTLPADELKAAMKRSVGKTQNYFQFKHNRASGVPVDVEVYSGPIEMNGRELLYSIVHDISDRTAVIKALQESEERFRTLVDYAPDAIFVFSELEFVVNSAGFKEREFAFVNPAGLKLLGAENQDELLGKHPLSILHPDYHEEQWKYMAEFWAGRAAPTTVERAYVRLDEQIVYADVTVVPICFNGKNGELVFARDITERKRHEQKEQEMEAQLRQQQKLEAIGTLAGGVAHEINNPLNGIMNYAQLILDASEKDTASETYSSEIIHETERISVIVKNLLQFSRQEKQSHSYASIYDIINQTISLVNTIIKKDQIKLDVCLDEDLPDIKCRSQQIQQVIMNLLTNARDALNEKYPGYDDNKLIRLGCCQYRSDDRRWLRLTVQDHGVGIPQELGERIFEPFFSTKPKETGTGLGLSISYGIVSEHHGKLTFESAPGAYTTFILELPVDNGWSL
jgi:PAS domain S-box-containing protein